MLTTLTRAVNPFVDSTVVETYVESTWCLTVCMHVIFRVFSTVRRYCL